MTLHSISKNDHVVNTEKKVLLNTNFFSGTVTHLHPPPSTSTQLISTSTQLIPASAQLSATPSTIFEPIVPRNWAISPNFGRKIKSYPFCLEISAPSISRMLIPNPDLDF